VDRAEIVYSYKGDGITKETAYQFAVRNAYPNVYRVRDATGSSNMIPDPNAGICYIEADADVLDQMDADGVPILWREEIPEDAF